MFVPTLFLQVLLLLKYIILQMSKFQKPTLYNGRGLDNQWMNLIYNSHDLMCGCNNVKEHLLDILNNQKCHHSTEEISTKETTGITNENADILEEGDLTRLFEESDDIDG